MRGERRRTRYFVSLSRVLLEYRKIFMMRIYGCKYIKNSEVSLSRVLLEYRKIFMMRIYGCKYIKNSEDNVD